MATKSARTASPAGRPRNLAQTLVASLGDRIRDGRLAPGEKLPTEAAIMAEHGVSPREDEMLDAALVAGADQACLDRLAQGLLRLVAEIGRGT